MCFDKCESLELMEKIKIFKEKKKKSLILCVSLKTQDPELHPFIL
jgi:hypothetical protein